MKKRPSSNFPLRSSQGWQQASANSRSRDKSASSSTSNQIVKKLLEDQDNYFDQSNNNENYNLNQSNKNQQKRLQAQTSSSKKIQNSSIQKANYPNKVRRFSSKKASFEATAGMKLNSQDSGLMQDWLLGTEKVDSRDNQSVKSFLRVGSKQSSLASKNIQRPTQSHKNLLNRSPNDQESSTQVRQNQPSQLPIQINMQQSLDLDGVAELQQKSSLNKQSSLKKFEQRLYQHSYTKVFVMGDTKFGQLGFLNQNEPNSAHEQNERTSSIINVPKLCSYNILIKQIACGEAHTHLLSADGYVYSMGSNQYGVLGLGKGDDILKAVTQPQLVPGLQCIIAIATGRSHTLALDVKRETYGWGRSDNGAIGLRMATPQHQSNPMTITLNLDASDQVAQIDCGLEHSCFLTSDGHVFACGEGEFGQLGVGYVSLKEYRPMRVKFKDLPAGDYVTKVACGAYHTSFLTRFNQVYVTGANNLGQLGIDSLESQVNLPTLVKTLTDKFISDIACGEGSFAITTNGELYIWGLYNLELYRKPFMPSAFSRPIVSVSQSFSGVTAAVDLDEQAWYWHSQLNIETQNAMKLPAYPTVVKQMKKRLIKKTIAGKDLIFALGEDVHASSSSVRDSQTASKNYMQEIPERDERPGSSTMSKKKMPALNLSNIHAGSTISLDKQKHIVTIKRASSVKARSRSRTPSRSRSNKKYTAKDSIITPKTKSKSNSPRLAKTQTLKNKFALKKRKSANIRSASKNNSESRKPKRSDLEISRSKSRGSSAPRSNSHMKRRTSQAPKAKNAYLASTQQSKSQNKINKKRPNLEKQVHQKFQDLTQRLEHDKEDVAKRLAKLSKKVSRIQKSKSYSQNEDPTKQKKVKVNKQAMMPIYSAPLEKLQQKSSQNLYPSDIRSGSYDVTSHQPDVQHHTQILINDQQQVMAKSQQNEVVGQEIYGIFNSEIQEEMDRMSKPHLIFSPNNEDSVDIRSLQKGLKVDASNSPNKHTEEARNDGNSQMGIFRYKLRVTSPSVRSPTTGRVKSPKNKNQQRTYDGALISQLREQIIFLEKQNSKLREEKVQEQVKTSEYQNKYEKIRQQNLRMEFTNEDTLRSLESQLRTSKLEKTDLAIRNADAERRVRDLEDKVINLNLAKQREEDYLRQVDGYQRQVRDLEERVANLTQAKNKEDDYLRQLGKTHENLRMEKNKNRDFQAQIQMLHNTLNILESTIQQVKRDKEFIEQEYARLKQFFDVQDIEESVNDEQKTIRDQIINLGVNSRQNMQHRSSSHGGLSHKSHKDQTQSKRLRSNSSLIKKHMEYSTERGLDAQEQHRRASSQLSCTPKTTTFNLISPQPVELSKEDVSVGGKIIEQYIGEPSQFFSVDTIYVSKNTAAFQTKESKDTGHFEEPSVTQTQNGIEEYEDQQRRDPRIQRLLEDAKVLQEKHRLLISSSPLRLKDRSAERSSNIVQTVLETTERAKSLNYTRLTEKTIVPFRDSSPAIYQKSYDSSYLRRKSPSRRSPSPSSSGFRAYYEPPAESDRISRMSSIIQNSQLQPRQQTILEYPDEDDEYEQELSAPAVEDFSPNQIRERAGIQVYPISRTIAVSERPKNFKDFVSGSQRAQPLTRLSQDDDHKQPQRNRVQKHDNQDYKQRKREDSGIRKSECPPLREADMEKLADQYNMQLLDKIERLAEKAKKGVEEPPRVNNFKRPAFQKEKSVQLSSPSPTAKRLSSNNRLLNQNLPAQIFDDDKTAYQNKLRGIGLKGNTPAENPTKRPPSTGSAKRPDRRRTQSKDEDYQETMQMLSKPKGGAMWTTGLNQKSSIEPEKPCAKNNSFLARREALQNRLKKM